MLQNKMWAIPKEKTQTHRDGPRPHLDEISGYTLVQFHQSRAYSGADIKSSGSYAFFCTFIGQFETSLFISVQAEVEDMTWAVKEMTEERLSNAPRCSAPSPFSMLTGAMSCEAGEKGEPLRSALCLAPQRAELSSLSELSICLLAPKVTSCHFDSWDIILGPQLHWPLWLKFI